MGKSHWTQHTNLFKKDEYECSACGAMYDKPYAVCPNSHSQMGKAKYDTLWVDEMAEYDEIFGDGDN